MGVNVLAIIKPWGVSQASVLTIAVIGMVSFSGCKKNGAAAEPQNVVTVQLPEKVEVSPSGKTLKPQLKTVSPVLPPSPPAAPPKLLPLDPGADQAPMQVLPRTRTPLKHDFVIRDPFRSYLSSISQKESVQTAAEALLDFGVQNYRYVGVIISPSSSLALVEDPAGIGHTLRIGSIIGREGGRVQSISEQQVVVREERRDERGKVRLVYTTLKLGR